MRGLLVLQVLVLATALETLALASDSATRAFELATKSERNLSGRSSATDRRRVADRFVAVADRYPGSTRAPESLRRAARVLAPPHVVTSDELVRDSVDLRKRFARDFPDDERAAEELFSAAELETTRLADPSRARVTLNELVTSHPASPLAPKALDRLTSLRGTGGVSDPDSPAREVSAAPREPVITRIRAWSGPGGVQIVVDVDGEPSVASEWDPNDVARGSGHVLRVTIPKARPAQDLAVPDLSENRWLGSLTVLQRASGGVRIELLAHDALGHEAFALGNQIVITLAPVDRGPGTPLVVIDPGHGGKDPGAQNPDGVFEKAVTLSIARRLALRLEEDHLRVVLTRDRDEFVPLEERTAIANTRGGDVLVSIHANATSRAEACGVETYFLAPTRDAGSLQAASRENGWSSPDGSARASMPPVIRILDDLTFQFHASESRRLAQAVHRRLVTALAALRPITDLGVKQAPFVVLMGSEMPALLVEVGFITHPEEGRRLADPEYQDAIATSLAHGVVDFLGSTTVSGIVR